MNLRIVTMTGADDSINPAELVALSQEFPFVEWGILLSNSQEGGSRFPSRQWIEKLAMYTQAHGLDEKVNTSGHICGQWLRALLKGKWMCCHFDLGLFERVQLNLHGEQHEVIQNGFVDLLQRFVLTGRKIIFQWDGKNNYILNNAIANGIDGQALFDLSHGAGIAPAEWPEPLKYTLCGYAGGLGPDNLAAELKRISEKVGDKEIWIDMETKVRSENDRVFDLNKVRKCLEIAKRYMEAA